MNRLLSLWKQPTLSFEEILSKKINWWRSLLLFGCQGILYVHIILKTGGHLDISSSKMFFATTLFLVGVGMLYGILSNLLIGLFIKLTGRFFGAVNDLKTIYNALTWAYLPSSVSVVLILISLVIAESLLSGPTSGVDIILVGFIVLFNLIQSIIGIWQFLLLYKGLKVAQELNRTNTILNYLLGAVILGVLNYLLIF